MSYKILTPDFTSAPDLQHNVDDSNSGTTVFIENKNNVLWYIKPAYYIDSIISQLLGSKVYKHFLGEYASTDILVHDNHSVFIASQQIPGFKTLNQVGNLCDAKKILGVEKLYAAGLLIAELNTESKNLGVVVQDHQCIATRVDADECLQVFEYWYERHFNEYAPHYNYNHYNRFLNNYFQNAVLYKVVRDLDQGTISLGTVYEWKDIDQVKMERTIQLNTVNEELKEKIFSQLNERPDYITLSAWDASKLVNERVYPYTSNRPEIHINVNKLLIALEDAIALDTDNIRTITHSVIEEVKLHYSIKQLQEQFKYTTIKSFEQLEDGYVAYISKNQEAVKHFYDSIEKKQFAEKCYEIGLQEDLHQSVPKNKTFQEVYQCKLSAEDEEVCVSGLSNWGLESVTCE